MGSIIISENDTIKETLFSGLSLFEQNGGFIPSEGKILIAVDMFFPHPFPVSFNPDTLLATIMFLKNWGLSDLYLLPIVSNGFNSDNLLSNYGLSDWIKAQNVSIINKADLFIEFNQDFQDEGISPTAINTPSTDSVTDSLSQIACVVFISQLKPDPLLGLWTSLPLLSALSSSKINNAETDYSTWISQTMQVLSQDKPLLIINDGFIIMDQNGPCIGKTYHSKPVHRIYIGNDCGTLDWVTLTDFGLDPMKNPFLKELMSENKLPAEKVIVKTDETMKSLEFLPIPSDLSHFVLPGLTLHLGTLSDGEYHSLYLLLLQLQSILFKDAYNIGKWVILAGTNPSEPYCTGKESIIVFGDSAIQSTQKYEFRSVLKSALQESLKILGFEIGITQILAGDELDRFIVKKQAKPRRKNELLRSKLEKEIALLDRDAQNLDVEILRLQKEKKLAKKTISFRYKSEKIRFDLVYKHAKLTIQNRAPKIIINRKVLDIPGSPPIVLNCMNELAHFWPQKSIPTLTLDLQTMKNVFEFAPRDTKLKKKQQKLLKTRLKAKLAQLYRPILPQIKADLKIAKETYQGELNLWKQNRKNAKEEIKQKFDPKIKLLKSKKKALGKEVPQISSSISSSESIPEIDHEEQPGGGHSNE